MSRVAPLPHLDASHTEMRAGTREGRAPPLSPGPVALRVGLAITLWVGARALIAAPAAEDPQASLQELGAKLEAAYVDLEAEYRALPHDLFEPSAVLEMAGRDDTALLQWVAKETSWLPYEGLLKGPVGTLADRAGNSLDRSLLLAAVLEAAGYRARLAHATLTDEEAGALVARWKPPPPAALAADCAPANADVTRRVAEHAADLEAALQGLLAPPASRQAELLAAARDHWWVERGEGDAWKALDPASPEKPLRERAEATVELPRGAAPLDVPAHTVELAVIIESWDAGELVEQSVVRTTVRPCDLHAKRIVLMHHPMTGESPLDDAANLALVKKTALAETEWLPILIAGDRHIARASFDDAGVVHDHPSLNAAGKLGAAAGSLFGGLAGDVAGGARESKEKESSVLTAEWVELTIQSPGRPVRVVRREVFDLLGPAARSTPGLARPALGEEQRLQRALALAGSCEWLALPNQLPWALVRSILAKRELDQRSTFLSILKEPDRGRRRVLAGTLQELGPLYWVAVARRTLNPGRGEIYLQAPDVLGFHVRPRMEGDGKLVEEAILDMATCPVASVPGASSVLAVVRQGVADAAAEDIALQKAPEGVGSTLDVLALAKAQGLKLITLRSSNDPAFAAMKLPPDTRARIVANLTAGHVVVFPEKPVEVAGKIRTGWWQVNTATGETTAVMDTGYHQDVTEEAFLENDTVAGQTLVRNRFHRNPFWRRHPGQIARDMGFNPEDMNVLNLILDYQQGLLQLGLL